METGLGLNIQTLTRPVFNRDVEIVGNIEVLPRCIIDTRADSDSTPIGGVVSKVDASYFARGRVDDLDLCGTNVVVEQLDVADVTRTVPLSGTQVPAVTTVSKDSTNERPRSNIAPKVPTYQQSRCRIRAERPAGSILPGRLDQVLPEWSSTIEFVGVLQEGQTDEPLAR